jgi:predicted nucleotidyltransferase
MDTTVQEELGRIVSAIVETGIISKIILFGSYAKGEETPDSDIDLCVLTPEKDKRPIDIMVDLRILLSDIQRKPMDLFAYNQDVFQYHAGRSTSFEHTIVEEGVTLYEHK